MPDTNSPSTDGFDPSDINTNLVKSVIALPLLKEIQNLGGHPNPANEGHLKTGQ